MYYTILCFTIVGFVFESNALLLWQDNPNGSSTSKKVTCNNCPYMVSYVSAETSTSGILLEDVLHLTQADDNHDLIEANDLVAPNGLFGLGMEKISVLSMLSMEGFTANSFSMCFGLDGFRDKGSLNKKTPIFKEYDDEKKWEKKFNTLNA